MVPTSTTVAGIHNAEQRMSVPAPGPEYAVASATRAPPVVTSLPSLTRAKMHAPWSSGHGSVVRDRTFLESDTDSDSDTDMRYGPP